MGLESAFKNLVVCDLSQGIAGPYATMLLAQFGAKVIKVEQPSGDWGRELGERRGDQTIHFWHYNLGKRSIVLDLKKPEGRQVLKKIVQQSRVFVESFRPGVAARLGIGYESIRDMRPDIVYASMSGFGQTGPYSQRGTVDALMQGFSGLMAMNRTPDGVPHRLNMVAVDVMSGLYLTTALAAALASGEGACLDISMMQSAAAFQGAKIAEAAVFGDEPSVFYGPVGRLPTRDGAVSISCRKQEHFEALCDVVRRPDLVNLEHFGRVEARVEKSAELMIALGDATRGWPTEDLLARLQERGVLVEKLQNYGEWLEDRHVKKTDAFRWVKTGAFGELPLARVPGLPAMDAAAPGLGEHSLEILAEFGASPAEVQDLIAAGAVRTAEDPTA